MKNRFTIDLIGDVDLEGMLIEISIENKLIASLNYEKGIDKIEIKLEPIPPEIEQMLIFPLDEFLHVLEKARGILVKCYTAPA